MLNMFLGMDATSGFESFHGHSKKAYALLKVCACVFTLTHHGERHEVRDCGGLLV